MTPIQIKNAAAEAIRAFGGLMQYTHANGPDACCGIAFYGPLGVLTDSRPLVHANRGLLQRLEPETFCCNACGRMVTRAELRPEVATLPHVYVADRRRARRAYGLRPLTNQKAPASLGQIAAATGYTRRKLREMCEAGAVPGAFRHHGARREWRVPMIAARRLIALLTSDTAAA